MSDTISQGPPPGLQGPNGWRTLCSHTTMERVFDTQDDDACCQFCGAPELGWVYSCTEDRNCVAVQEDPSPSTTTGRQELGEDGEVKLNDWVGKAVEEGHYNKAQVQTLRQQRAKVQELIANGNRTPMPEQSTKDASNNNDGEDESSQSAENGLNSGSMDQRLTTLVQLLERGRQKVRNDRLKGACNLRLCPSCFPSGLDRAWLSLNEICNTSAQEERPHHISQIPSTDIPIVRSQVESSVKEPINTNDSANLDSHSQPPSNLTPTKESPSSSQQNVPELPVRHHARQSLGTPRKVSRWERPVPSSNENSPPSPVRPSLTRRPEWKKDQKPDPEERDRSGSEYGEEFGPEESDIYVRA